MSEVHKKGKGINIAVLIKTIFESLPKGKDWQLSVMSIKALCET